MKVPYMKNVMFSYLPLLNKVLTDLMLINFNVKLFLKLPTDLLLLEPKKYQNQEVYYYSLIFYVIPEELLSVTSNGYKTQIINYLVYKQKNGKKKSNKNLLDVIRITTGLKLDIAKD